MKNIVSIKLLTYKSTTYKPLKLNSLFRIPKVKFALIPRGG